MGKWIKKEGFRCPPDLMRRLTETEFQTCTVFSTTLAKSTFTISADFILKIESTIEVFCVLVFILLWIQRLLKRKLIS